MMKTFEERSQSFKKCQIFLQSNEENAGLITDE